MKKIKLSFSRLFQSNRLVLVMSLVAAIAIWISVSPNRELDISVPVNIATENTAVGTLGLEIVEGQGTPVSVTVAGKWYEISKLTENDIKVSVSLADVNKAGEYELNLTAQKVNSNANFEISRITPEKVAIKFDYTYTRGFDVQAKVNGVKAASGLIADTPVLNLGNNDQSNIVQITGPKSIVETIATVVAEVDVNETLSSTSTYTAKIKVLDAGGNEVDKSLLKLPITEAQITVPINREKEVPLAATFVNQPEAYLNTPIPHTLSREKVSLIGPPEVIDELTALSLPAIDFQQITPENPSFVLELSLPSGVRVSNDLEAIIVTVNMDGYSMKTFEVSNFIAVNAPKGQTVTVKTKSKSIRVVGPTAVINRLNADDLSLRYDLTNVQNASGDHMVNASIYSGTYNTIWDTGNCQIQVNISD